MFSLVLIFALQAAHPAASKTAIDPNHELDVDIRFSARSFAAADLDRNGVLSLAEYMRALDTRFGAAIAANPAAQAKIKNDTRRAAAALTWHLTRDDAT